MNFHLIQLKQLLKDITPELWVVSRSHRGGVWPMPTMTRSPFIQSRWGGTITSWVTSLWQLCGEGGPPHPTSRLWVSVHRGRRLLLCDSCHGPPSPSPLPPAQISTSLPLPTTCCPLKPVSERGNLRVWRRNLVQWLKIGQFMSHQWFWTKSWSLQMNALSLEWTKKQWQVKGAGKKKRPWKKQQLQKFKPYHKMSLCTHLVWLTGGIW